MRGVPRKGKKAHADFQVRLGEDELGRIFHLRDSLEQSESLIQNAERYREMDWVLEARGEGGATLDFSKPSDVWGERLMTLALAGVELDLAVRTGLPSQLLVLEAPRGETLLDTYGEWHSDCRALSGSDWEQHFFALPPDARVLVSKELKDFHIRIYGQDGLVPVPPSRRPGGEPWVWLAAPWDLTLAPPGPPVWEFLEDFGFLKEAEAQYLAEEMLSWDQVYGLIVPHQEVIRTLLTPAASVSAYYRQLADQAQQAGISDPNILCSLLWHAPQGDARTSPDRLAYIRKLCDVIRPQNGGGIKNKTSPAAPLPGPAAPGASPPEHGASPDSSRQNDLVEFMENRVVLARSRYESIIYELAELTAKAEALQRRVAEWEQRYPGGQLPEPPGAKEVNQTTVEDPLEFPFDPPVGEALPGQKRKPLPSLKAAAQEFLRNNSDLAADAESVRMLQFCLRNYIDLNPELNALPLGEKLEMAGKMAREFMNQVCHRGA